MANTNLISLFDEVNRSVSIAVLLGGIGPVLQKQLDDLVLALGGALVQGGEPPEVASVDGGAVFNQELRHLKMAIAETKAKK